MQEDTRKKLGLVLDCVISLSPIIVSTILLYVFFKKNIFDFTPYDSDEVVYWYSSKTFAAAGWRGGFFGASEQQAPWHFSHFGLHGPLFPALYAILNLPFGWHLWSGVVTNHVILIGALFFYFRQTALKTSIKIILLFFIFTFWPLQQFSTCNMQESWHQALAIFLAALFIRKAKPECRNFDYLDGIGLFLLLYTSAMRPSWSLFFLPFVHIVFTGRKARFFGYIFAVLMVPLSPLLFKLLAAPMPDGGAQFVKFMTGGEAWNNVVSYFWANYQKLYQGDPTEMNQTKQIVLVIAFAVLFSAFRLIFNFKLFLSSVSFKILSTVAFILSGLLFATLAMYLVGGQADYRVLSSPFLFAILYLCKLDSVLSKGVILLCVILNVSIVSGFTNNYRGFRNGNYTFQKGRIEEPRVKLAKVLHFQPDKNPWCNTILSAGLEPWILTEFASIPSGFGIVALWKWRHLERPAKSQYMFFDVRSIKGERVAYLPLMKVTKEDANTLTLDIENWGEINLEKIGIFNLGHTLYLMKNLDSHCENQEW